MWGPVIIVIQDVPELIPFFCKPSDPTPKEILKTPINLSLCSKALFAIIQSPFHLREIFSKLEPEKIFLKSFPALMDSTWMGLLCRQYKIMERWENNVPKVTLTSFDATLDSEPFTWDDKIGLIELDSEKRYRYADTEWITIDDVKGDFSDKISLVCASQEYMAIAAYDSSTVQLINGQTIGVDGHVKQIGIKNKKLVVRTQRELLIFQIDHLDKSPKKIELATEENLSFGKNYFWEIRRPDPSHYQLVAYSYNEPIALLSEQISTPVEGQVILEKDDFLLLKFENYFIKLCLSVVNNHIKIASEVLVELPLNFQSGKICFFKSRLFKFENSKICSFDVAKKKEKIWYLPEPIDGWQELSFWHLSLTKISFLTLCTFRNEIQTVRRAHLITLDYV